MLQCADLLVTLWKDPGQSEDSDRTDSNIYINFILSY